MNGVKRICCFCERWESGGIESFLCNVLTRMNLADLEVDIVTASLGASVFTASLQGRGVRFIELSGGQRNILKNHREFRMLLRARRYDILHLNAFHGLSMAYLHIAEQEGIPVRIAHSHNTALRASLIRPLKLAIHTWAKERYTSDATDLWACSKKAAEFLFPKGILQRRGFRYIPNGIDVERFRFNPKIRTKVRAELGIENSLIIGNVGRLCYQKNQSFLLDVLVEALKHRPDIRLLLVGEGEDRPTLEEESQRMGVADKVLFYGTTNCVEQLLWIMDVFAFPSLFEGLGIVAVEAQAAGLPVVCSEFVPEEAHVTSHLQTVSLTRGPSAWAAALLTVLGRFQNSVDAVRAAGFDILDTARRVEICYSRSSLNGKP